MSETADIFKHSMKYLGIYQKKKLIILLGSVPLVGIILGVDIVCT